MKDLAKSLHPLERKLLPFIKQKDTFLDLLKSSGMKDIEVMRTLQWLASKSIVELSEKVEELAALGENGKKALAHGLPEKRFLEQLKSGPKTLDDLKKVLSPDEVNVCIGLLRSKGAIEMSAGKINITDSGRALLVAKSAEEFLLEKLSKGKHTIASLTQAESDAFASLKKRKDMVSSAISKSYHILLTSTGTELQKMDLEEHASIDRLTPDMLRSGAWKEKSFRPFEVSATLPKLQRGRRHFVNQAIASTKRIWTDMGFKEMRGCLVQTSFWNFDALFTAQDHPVRDMQDTFFIKSPSKGQLPDKILVDRVKRTHENGWTTSSKGWRYDWSSAESSKNVLRTHTTVLSAKTIASLKKSDLPAKYFAVGKCFRNETLDWSHLFEFNQTEGIVIDENANFRNLLGYLKAYFKKMGYEKARFRPAYFPYTEFSVEIDVFHPVHKKWLELGGAGIFRPEVVKPLLGYEVPVLAWGPGFDRIITDYFAITDIRDLYRNDLKQLREAKEWMQ